MPVTRRLLADSETAVGVYRKLAGNRPGTVLLESAEQGKRWARYSFVGVRSAGVLTERDGATEWLGDADPGADRRPAGRPAGRPSARWPAGSARRARPDLPPLTGGLVGYLGYDVVRRLERLPRDQRPTTSGMPELAMMLVTDLAVLDHTDGSVLLIANALRGSGGLRRRRRPAGRHGRRPDEGRCRPGWPCSSRAEAPPVHQQPGARGRSRTAWSGSASTSAPATPSRSCWPSASRWPTDVDALDLYRVLRATNPSPYMYLLRFAGRETPFDVVGSSPEALVTVTGDAGRRAPAGRHPAPRGDPRRRTSGWPRRCSPTRRSARST